MKKRPNSKAEEASAEEAQKSEEAEAPKVKGLRQRIHRRPRKQLLMGRKIKKKQEDER